MRGIQEQEEKEIKIKLHGINIRSYLDIALKQPSSAIVAEQDELEIDFNTSKQPTLKQLQLQNKSFQKQSQSDSLIQKYKPELEDSLQQFSGQNKDQSQQIQGDLDEELKVKKVKIQETLLNKNLEYNLFNDKKISQMNTKNSEQSKKHPFVQPRKQNQNSDQCTYTIAAWIFEMVLQMNTATYHEGDFITDRKTIFRIYVKEYFIFEVLPLLFEGKTSSNPTINILLHLPLLLKLKGMSIILIHLMACSYATLGNFERNILQTQENWIDLGKIQSPGYCWWTIYIEAQLWAFYTLSNSYSSSVVTKYEYAFTSFWMLISCVVFAYNIITLGKIFQDINSAKENYQKDLNLLNRFMKRKKIDLEFQRAINSHLIKQYEQEISSQFEAEKQTLQKLSPHMRNKLIMESNKGIITQFSIFNNLSQQTIYNIYQIMEEECYSEGQEMEIIKIYLDQILSKKTDSNKNHQIQSILKNNKKRSLKYMNAYDKGSQIQQYEKSICFLKEGRLLGEYEFFSNISYPYKQSFQKINAQFVNKQIIILQAALKLIYLSLFTLLQPKVTFQGVKKSQRLIIDIPTQQIISSGEEDENDSNKVEQEFVHFQSQLNPVFEEDTSIFLQNNKNSSYKTYNKQKYNKEESKTELSESQESNIQGENTFEQTKNFPSNILNKRQSYKTRISLIKQQRKSFEKQEDLTSNHDKIDQNQKKPYQEEKSLTLNIDEKILNMNSSSKNTSELSQYSTLQPSNSLKHDQSLKSMNSQQTMKKQSQFQKHLTYLESIREIESHHQIYNPNKKSELSCDNICIGNGFAPLNTIQSGQLSCNKFHDQQCSQQKINNQHSKKIWNESNLYWDFDKIENFIYFFPQFNYKNVLKNIKSLKDKKNSAKQYKYNLQIQLNMFLKIKMRGFQEVEKQIKIKLSGQNKRSYLDIAQKLPSSTLMVDQDDQESKNNQSRLPTQLKLQLIRVLQAKQAALIRQKVKRKISGTLALKRNMNLQKSLKLMRIKGTEAGSHLLSREAKANNHNRQKKHSMHIKQREKKSLLTSAQKSEFLHSKIKNYIVDFINKFTLFGRFKQMKEKSRQLLGDLSDKYTYMAQNKKYCSIYNLLWIFLQFLKKLEKFIILIFENLPLFNPENKLRICVNGLIACYNCFYLFTISLTLFFQAEFQDYHNLFHQIAIAAWVLEMFLQMNTATYHEGDFITDRKTIFRIYVKEYFFFEVLPLIFEGKTSSNAAINVLLHLPLLLKLKVHFMACSYATLAYFENHVLQIEETWINLGKIQKPDSYWWTNYLEAQLWAFYTLSSSYSSSVFSQYEYAFTSFWMLISYVFYAYNLMVLRGILLEMNSAKENYKKDLNLLNRYMKRKKIDLELQRAINSHVVKQYEQEAQTQFEAEKDALKKLSPHMRNKLVMESNKNIATIFPFFENLSSQTILNLYQIMEEECHAEGQDIQIFDKNTQEYFVFLILSGRVEILQTIEGHPLESISSIYEPKNMNIEDKFKKSATVQLHQKSVCYLKEGQIFGEYEFFTKTELPYVIKQLSTQQILSNNDDIEIGTGFTQSQLSPIKDDETSIFKQQNNQATNQNSTNKFKFSKEESKSEQSDSQEQESQAKEKANDEVLSQIKNVLSNLGTKRSSIISNISIMRQQARNIERQDSNINQERMDLLKKQSVNEEKLTTQNTDERNVSNHLNNSQNNLSEHNPSQTMLYPIPQSQFNKSGNQLPSLQVIKKQNQYQHQIYLESIPELDVKHNIQQDQYRHSNLSQNTIFRGNSLIPLNTAQAKRYSISKNRNSLNLNSPLKFDEGVFKLIWNRSNLYWEFDKLANFIYFFPQYNIKNVLKNTKSLYINLVKILY
ncbi:cation channel family protein (macronuclear) [Tetrahymena thermophila SB210]|uniref:Cation channel family protein n=1 Tax=Tetrahymena thermophila (strain SB210) TaxID=312017 RepID=Q235E2_TETTS|nr:cation channel family protein [Tetrahymena thermophila SB210]EAR92161.2 cation channel family protein [Tetrahymena thermophila SB210]|eukprot:XP_001012406.2 cation channel family protein [Tetrahymena thermophila SB210]